MSSLAVRVNLPYNAALSRSSNTLYGDVMAIMTLRRLIPHKNDDTVEAHLQVVTMSTHQDLDKRDRRNVASQLSDKQHWQVTLEASTHVVALQYEQMNVDGKQRRKGLDDGLRVGMKKICAWMRTNDPDVVLGRDVYIRYAFL